MIYTYTCPSCAHRFEVTKPLAEIDRVEPCDKCQTPCARVPTVTGFTNSDSLGRRKAPAEFRDFMKKIHNDTPGSQITSNCDVD